MRFEVTEKVTTFVTAHQLLDALEQQFRKSAQTVERTPVGLTVKTITDTFGAVNRSDVTTVSLKPVSQGYMISADVNYKPSVFFWILTISLLFTAFGWIFPIAFFFYNRTVVQKSIEATLQRIRNEFSQDNAQVYERSGIADELEKLGSLKERGLLTEQEFNLRKGKLLEA